MWSHEIGSCVMFGPKEPPEDDHHCDDDCKLSCCDCGEDVCQFDDEQIAAMEKCSQGYACQECAGLRRRYAQAVENNAELVKSLVVRYLNSDIMLHQLDAEIENLRRIA